MKRNLEKYKMAAEIVRKYNGLSLKELKSISSSLNTGISGEIMQYAKEAVEAYESFGYREAYNVILRRMTKKNPNFIGSKTLKTVEMKLEAMGMKKRKARTNEEVTTEEAPKEEAPTEEAQDSIYINNILCRDLKNLTELVSTMSKIQSDDYDRNVSILGHMVEMAEDIKSLRRTVEELQESIEIIEEKVSHKITLF